MHAGRERSKPQVRASAEKVFGGSRTRSNATMHRCTDAHADARFVNYVRDERRMMSQAAVLALTFHERCAVDYPPMPVLGGRLAAPSGLAGAARCCPSQLPRGAQHAAQPQAINLGQFSDTKREPV